MTTIKRYRKFLGPTQFASCIGYDRYLSSDQLRQEIEHGYMYTDTPCLQFGQNHECVALYYYSKMFKTEIVRPRFIVDPKNSRIGGIGDGLIGSDCGIEVKCHVGTRPLKTIPYKYLIQIAGYLYLYKRSKWILFSCTFNSDHTLGKYKIFEITWDMVKDRWERDWYPQINNFLSKVTFAPQPSKSRIT